MPTDQDDVHPGYAATCDELTRRILDLIPANPSIMTCGVWDLFKIPGFHCDDIGPSLAQAGGALGKARAIHRENLVVTHGDAEQIAMTNPELAVYRESTGEPRRCPKCGMWTPAAFITGDRCPRCLADEIEANRPLVQAEFDRLRAAEVEWRHVMADRAFLMATTDPDARLTNDQLRAYRYRRLAAFFFHAIIQAYGGDAGSFDTSGMSVVRELIHGDKDIGAEDLQAVDALCSDENP